MVRIVLAAGDEEGRGGDEANDDDDDDDDDVAFDTASMASTGDSMRMVGRGPTSRGEDLPDGIPALDEETDDATDVTLLLREDGAERLARFMAELPDDDVDEAERGVRDGEPRPVGSLPLISTRPCCCCCGARGGTATRNASVGTAWSGSADGGRGETDERSFTSRMKPGGGGIDAPTSGDGMMAAWL